jgi:hypothetical protein
MWQMKTLVLVACFANGMFVMSGCTSKRVAIAGAARALSEGERFLVAVDRQMGIAAQPLTNMANQTSGKALGPKEFFFIHNASLNDTHDAHLSRSDASWALGIALMTEDEADIHLATCAKEITVLSSEEIGPHRLVCTFHVTGMAAKSLDSLHTSFLSLVDNLAKKVNGEPYDHYWDRNTWWEHNRRLGVKLPDLTPPQNPSPPAQ